MFAKFSPDATRVGYVRGNNIYVERLDDGTRHAADDRRIGNDHQRHLRLGLRRGVRRSRRLPLQPGRQVDRLLAVRQHRRRHLLADQQHRHALSGDHQDSVSEGRHDELGGARRRGQRRRRRDDVDQDRGRSAQHLPRAHRLDRFEHGVDSAAEPPAEPQRLPHRRHQDRRGEARVPRRIEVVGRQSSRKCRGSMAAAPSCG